MFWEVGMCEESWGHKGSDQPTVSDPAQELRRGAGAKECFRRAGSRWGLMLWSGGTDVGVRRGRGQGEREPLRASGLLGKRWQVVCNTSGVWRKLFVA